MAITKKTVEELRRRAQAPGRVTTVEVEHGADAEVLFDVYGPSPEYSEAMVHALVRPGQTPHEWGLIPIHVQLCGTDYDHEDWDDVDWKPYDSLRTYLMGAEAAHGVSVEGFDEPGPVKAAKRLTEARHTLDKRIDTHSRQAAISEAKLLTGGCSDLVVPANQPIPANHDCDGRDELDEAVYRFGLWFLCRRNGWVAFSAPKGPRAVILADVDQRAVHVFIEGACGSIELVFSRSRGARPAKRTALWRSLELQAEVTKACVHIEEAAHVVSGCADRELNAKIDAESDETANRAERLLKTGPT